MLDEIKISRAIIDTYFKKLNDALENEVIIVGAGPSGLTAGYYLGKEKIKTTIFERNLRPGGGMPGGGMMFNQMVIQKEAKEIFEELEISVEEYEANYFTADTLEALGILTAKCLQTGTKIFNLITCEDVLIREEKICGVVINWTSVEEAHLHVDPLTVRSQYVIDASGHQAEVVRIVEKKVGQRLFTPTGGIIGERPMWAEIGERMILENTKEVYHNLFVCGMAANTVFGGPRMGPIFGGMFLSGRKVAQLIKERRKIS
ncbi:MAG: sulfide-dependent adenosine diphosphate thiazole synthase [candidate division WOR-3 bacterium]